MQYKTKQSYAPFGSVSSKKEKKKKNNIQAPGPGSYDVTLPLISPIVQTIRKRNNNIIVKLGHIGTSSFLGNSHRFSEKAQSNLGPGQYYRSSSEDNHKEKSEKKNIQKYAALRLKQLINSPIERQPSISQIKRIDFDDEIQMPNKADILKNRGKEHGQIKGCAWSRMTEERSKSPSGHQNLGPGSYDLKDLQKMNNFKRQPSSAFVSKSVRSFFDQIRFETNHDEKARLREGKQYKSDMVGPGSYEVSPSKRRSLNQYQFFGSTEQRF